MKGLPDPKNLALKQLTNKTLPGAIKLLDKELGTERVRNRDFLKRKFKEFPQFFLGLFLDNEIIGIICGFPRGNYLLISEIAVDSRFQKKGFGKKLVKEFEKIGKKFKHPKIHVGARDSAIKFYGSLNYKPFLLIQFKEEDYNIEEFKKFEVLKKRNLKEGIILEIKSQSFSLVKLKKLRKKYPKAYFQYIFTKISNNE